MNPQAPGCSWLLGRMSRWVGALLFPCSVFGQFVETAYLLRLEIAAQTGPSTLETAGAAIIMGLDFSAPVSEALLGEMNVLMPTGEVQPLYLAPLDRTTATTEFLFDTRAEMNAFAPGGAYRFTSTFQPGFTGTINFPTAGFPPTPRITNYSELQSLGPVKTATVRWEPMTGSYQPDDVILVGVVNASGEEVYSSPDPWDPDALTSASGSATLFFPPGQTSIGTIIVMRQTASAPLPGNATGLAGYGTGTGFPIVSTGPLDWTAPVITARSPAIGAYGVDPNVPIELTFNEPMRTQGYIEDQSMPSNALQTSTWSADRRSVTIDLPEALPPGPVTLVLGNSFYPGMVPFGDLSGNPAADRALATSFFVGREPVFNQQPSPLPQLTIGSEMTISTDVIWPGQTLKFQWMRDGAPIPGATDASLSDPNFQVDESGIYELEVENEFGKVTSLPVLVVPDLESLRLRYVQIVGPNRSIGPLLEIPPGSTLQLTLDGVYGDDPTFQWRRNGSPLAGETGTTLTIPLASPDMDGVYDLLATNAYGSAASNALGVRITSDLPLPATPTIHQDRSVVPGGWLYLSAADDSEGLLIRNWTHNGEALPIDPTTELLELFDIQAQDAGVYAFTVSNGLETHTAIEYTVTLRDPDKPFITDQPGDTFFTEDSGATFGVIVEGRWPFMYQWFKDGVAIPGKTESVIAMDPGKPEQAGTYTVTVSNAFGSVQSLPAVVSYRPTRTAPSKPRVLPASGLVVASGSWSFHLNSEADWSPAWPREYQWKHDGQPIDGATEAWLNVFSPGPSATGSYTVVYRNEYGESESDPVTVRIIGVGDPPEIIGPPESLGAAAGSELWLNAPVVTPPGSTITWYLDGRNMTDEVIQSDDPFKVLIRCLQHWHAGNWSVAVTSGSHSVTVPAAEVTPIETGPYGSGRLSNVSTRAVLGEGNTTLIAGFVVEGEQAMRLLIRGVATGMENYLGPRAAGNSRIKVVRDDGMVVLNENWIRQEGVVALHEAAATAGAFPLDPEKDDAALVLEADPGRYTVQVLRDPDQPGIGLAEVYDLEPGISSSRVVNLSSRVYVGTEDERAIPGFVIGGSTSVKILARAIGPGLDAFDVSGAIRDPQLKIISSGSIELLSNDNWEDQIDPVSVELASERVGAFALDSGSLDSAVLATLPPGLYTVVVASADGTSGVALVELYEVPVDSE